MAAIEYTQTQQAAGKNGRVGPFVARAIARFNAWHDARSTRNALSKLSDRELEDIGLCRGDIDDISAAQR